MHGVTPGIVAPPDLIHRLAYTLVVLELEHIDVSAGFYLYVASTLVAMMLGDSGGAAQHCYQVGDGPLGRLVVVFPREILKKRGQTLHEVIDASLYEIHLEQWKLERTVDVFNFRNV